MLKPLPRKADCQGPGINSLGSTFQRIGSKPDTVIGGVQSGGAPWFCPAWLGSFGGGWAVSRRGIRLSSHKPWKSGSGQEHQRQPSLRRHRRQRCCHHDAIPLSPEGNAEFESRVNMPGASFGPAVLVRAVFNGRAGPWIGVTGFTQGSEPDDGDGIGDD